MPLRQACSPIFDAMRLDVHGMILPLSADRARRQTLSRSANVRLWASRLAVWLVAMTSLGPAAARVICTDEWGGVYRLQAAPKVVAARFSCRDDAAAASAPARSAALAHQVRNALSLPSPPAPVGRGNLALLTKRNAAPAVASTAPLEGMIASVAQKYGHDVRLLKAIIHVESRFNANAVSPKGAIGLMQVMPATGLRMGVQEPTVALFDPQTNLLAGARYLRLLMNMFEGQPELAIAAYNAGEGAVLRHRSSIPPFPETQAYVRDVIAQYHRY